MSNLFVQLGGWLGQTPAWIQSIIIVALGIGLALLAHRLLFRLIAHVIRDRDLFWRSLLKRAQGPMRLGMVLISLMLVSEIAPLSGDQASWMQRIIVVCMIATIAWVVWTALNIWMTLYLRRFTQDAEDSLLARKHVTQTHILKRVASFFIWLTAISASLMTFEEVRQYGISILASAGAAGVILGLALQPVLKNLLAGIQIAITQPIRIGDALIAEGEMGFVEDIRATYVVVRLWDLRRLVLPLSYFIEQPFQNWTRESTNLLGTVMIYLDYSVPIEALRTHAKSVVDASPLWDKKTFAVQVTDFRDSTMEVRILMSASDAGKLFDLRCDVREKMIAYLQAEHPRALPHVRTIIDGRFDPMTGREFSTAH
jgi:small-conductance mechanosensitive channel